MHKKSGYTFLEVLAVAVISSVVLAFVGKTVWFFMRETAQISRSALSTKRADFDRFIGILNDRLSQAWQKSVTDDSENSLPGKKLTLLDNNGNAFFSLGAYVSGATIVFHLQDLGTSYTQNAAVNQDLTYRYVDRADATQYGLSETADGYVTWKIPPPYYCEATEDSFKTLLVYNDSSDLHAKVETMRNQRNGLMHFDVKSYHYIPQQEGFR